MTFRISLIIAAGLLAACSDSERDMAATSPSTTASAAGESRAVQNSGVVFTVTPTTIRRCDAIDGNASVALNWDVREASVGFVTILVGDRTFAEGSASGTSTTGNWVRDDTVFSLIDAATKKPLATLQVPFVDC